MHKQTEIDSEDYVDINGDKKAVEKALNSTSSRIYWTKHQSSGIGVAQGANKYERGVFCMDTFSISLPKSASLSTTVGREKFLKDSFSVDEAVLAAIDAKMTENPAKLNGICATRVLLCPDKEAKNMDIHWSHIGGMSLYLLTIKDKEVSIARLNTPHEPTPGSAEAKRMGVDNSPGTNTETLYPVSRALGTTGLFCSTEPEIKSISSCPTNNQFLLLISGENMTARCDLMCTELPRSYLTGHLKKILLDTQFTVAQKTSKIANVIRFLQFDKPFSVILMPLQGIEESLEVTLYARSHCFIQFKSETHLNYPIPIPFKGEERIHSMLMTLKEQHQQYLQKLAQRDECLQAARNRDLIKMESSLEQFNCVRDIFGETCHLNIKSTEIKVGEDYAVKCSPSNEDKYSILSIPQILNALSKYLLPESSSPTESMGWYLLDKQTCHALYGYVACQSTTEIKAAPGSKARLYLNLQALDANLLASAYCGANGYVAFTSTKDFQKLPQIFEPIKARMERVQGIFASIEKHIKLINPPGSITSIFDRADNELEKTMKSELRELGFILTKCCAGNDNLNAVLDEFMKFVTGDFTRKTVYSEYGKSLTNEVMKYKKQLYSLQTDPKSFQN